MFFIQDREAGAGKLAWQSEANGGDAVRGRDDGGEPVERLSAPLVAHWHP